MTADYSIILNHPLNQEIISKLVKGIEPKEINQWLKLKYPSKDEKHLIVSLKLLQDFAKSQYNEYYDKFTKEITTTVQQGGKLDKKIADSLLNNKSFQERLSEHTLKEINIKDELITLRVLFLTRIEQLFDKAQENPGNAKGEYVLLKYFEQYLNLLDKYDKSQNNRPDQIIQHNYTVQYMNQTASAMQEGIRDALNEIDPDIALLVIEKISYYLSKMQQPIPEIISNTPQSPDDRLGEIKKLEASIISNEDISV